MVQRFIPVTGKFGIPSVERFEELQYYTNGFFNVYPEAYNDSRKACFQKRPGLLDSTQISGLSNLGVGWPNGYRVRGVIDSLGTEFCIMYLADNVNPPLSYIYTAEGGQSSNAVPVTFSITGPVVFERLDGVSYGVGNYFACTDFNRGALLNAGGAWTDITDAVFLGLTKVTNFLAMDGYLFIGTSNNRIYNSNLNTPGTWNALSFLTVADNPGSLVWLSRLRNYIVAFKEYSLEFYENMGKPTPGSPLGPQKQLHRKIGCASRSSIQKVSDGIIFIGIDTNGKTGIYKLHEDTLELKEISDDYMRAVCAAFPGVQSNYSVDNENTGAANPPRGESQVIVYQGKEFYTVNLSADGTAASKKTYVWDNSIQTWVNWKSYLQSGGDLVFEPGQATLIRSVTSGTPYTLFFNNYAVASGTSKARVCAWSPAETQYQDWNNGSSGNNYTYVWLSDMYDFNTRQRKFMDSLEVIYDSNTAATPNVTGTPSTFQLTVYDTDYQATGTGAHGSVKDIPYDPGMYKRAKVFRLGSFFSRAFKLTIQDSNPWRLWGLQTFVDVGDTENAGASQ